MIRATVLCAALLAALSACETPSASVPPAETPKPQAVDPRLCDAVPVRPAMPADADLVQPETIAERIGFEAMMTWVAQVIDHDTQMTARADLARRQSCKP